jgi:hypothetical protein
VPQFCSAVTDSQGLSNSCSATVTVVGVADLLVRLAVDKTSVKQGEQLTYTITVHNFGPQEAANVIINDTSRAARLRERVGEQRQLHHAAPNKTGTVTWTWAIYRTATRKARNSWSK